MKNVLALSSLLTVGALFINSIFSANCLGQDGDGEATVPLTLSPATRSMLEQILGDSVSGFGPAEHGVAAPLMTTSPLTDGVISPGEYANRIHYSFADRENPGNPHPDFDTIEPIDGSDENDLSANLYLAHTDQFLFLGFEVQDEFLDLDEGVDAFRNDSVELFINADLEIDDFNPDFEGRNASGEGFQIVADAAGVATVEEGEALDIDPSNIEFNNRFTNGSGPIPVDTGPPDEGEFYTAGLPNENGWTLEWQIPLATLDTDSDEGFDVVPAKTGDVMLMNFAINDNDIEFANGQDTHAMQWVVEDDPRSPFGGGENVWVVPLALTEAVGPAGDFDGDGDCDADDIDLLAAAIRTGDQNARFDVDGDGNINDADRVEYIKGIKNTFMGDSNLDGEFNSGDLVVVFSGGQYEDAVVGNSGWANGDWNGDGEFNSGDLVVAFTEGGYEMGPKPAAANVPEPTTLLLTLLGIGAFLWHRWRRT